MGMEIKHLGVLGAGTMGNGIAQVFARSGYAVTLCDVEPSILERALATIRANMERQIAKSKMTEAEQSATLKRIRTVTDRAALGACDLVVEAAWERLETK